MERRILKKIVYLFVWCSIYSSSDIWSQYRVKPTAYHQTMTYKMGQHIPLVFIVDQIASESPYKDSIASTYTLNIALKEKMCAILVSQSILYNFIYRKAHAKSTNIPVPLSQDSDFEKTSLVPDWDIYRFNKLEYFVGNTELFLLVPSNKREIFLPAFNIQQTQRVMSEHHLYPLFTQNIQPVYRESNLSLMAKDLQKIFKPILAYPSEGQRALISHIPETWTAPVFDIFLQGHGSLELPLIANFTPDEIKQLLAFFNNKLRIGSLIVSSCFAGGTNFQHFKFQEIFRGEKIPYALNFIVIVQGVEDKISFSVPDQYFYPGKKFFASIFYILENLGRDEQFSLKKLLKILGWLKTEQHDIPLHQESNIPQIILPGGIPIQTLTPDKNVMVLGSVNEKTAAFENKTINVFPRQLSTHSTFTHPLNVLVYPSIVNASVEVRASRLLKKDAARKKIQEQWKNFPSYHDLVISHPVIFPQAAAFSYYQYLYPNFIPMDREQGAQYFKHMQFIGDAQAGAGGLLMGMRDSFLSDKKRILVFIDTLEGSNDISLILQARRAIQGKPNALSPIEKELPPGGAPTVLHNIKISKLPTVTIITFSLKNTAWRLFPFGNGLWGFQNINFENYNKLYESDKQEIFQRHHEVSTPQKPLVAILKEHIARQQMASRRDSLFKLSSSLSALAALRHR